MTGGSSASQNAANATGVAAMTIREISPSPPPARTYHFAFALIAAFISAALARASM
jgi:hypothetical protein